MQEPINAVRIHPSDNVAVVIKEIHPGEPILGVRQKISARQNIPRNHKVALIEIPAGAKIIKYGETIGIAAQVIQPGDWVHTHNLKAVADAP